MAETQEGYPATGTEVRCQELNFQKLEPRSIVTMAKRGKQGLERHLASQMKVKLPGTREDFEVVTLEVSSGWAAGRKPSRVLVTKWANKVLENGKEICSQDFLTTFQLHR